MNKLTLWSHVVGIMRKTEKDSVAFLTELENDWEDGWVLPLKNKKMSNHSGAK